MVKPSIIQSNLGKIGSTGKTFGVLFLNHSLTERFKFKKTN
jgi:hypothetical protein